MDVAAALTIFVRVVETGSFSAVAKERNTSQSAVSRQITALEESLGVRLMHRTTRHLTLTEDGRHVLGHAYQVLEAIEATREAVGERRGSPSGHVRVGVRMALGHYLGARVQALLTQYPELSLELVAADGPRDLVEEGLDAAVISGPVSQTSLVVHRIGSAGARLVAAPSYLAGRPAITHPRDLQAHDCILYTGTPGSHVWHFRGPGGEVSAQVQGRLAASNNESIRAAAVAGVGLALLPELLVHEDICAGRLLPLLPAYAPQSAPISVVYPSRRNLPRRTRVVIDWLVAELGGALGHAAPSGCAAPTRDAA